MNPRPVRSRPRIAAALALLPVPALTACGPEGNAPGAPAAAPTDGPVTAVHKAASVTGLLPTVVRGSGTVRIGSSISTPPGTYYPNEPDKAPEKKGSALTKAFQAAVNELIKDGTYARILKKWGTSASAIDASRINPPEHG